MASSGQACAPSCVSLCAITNPRSGWNKISNISTFIQQIVPDIFILSEHWVRKLHFENVLALNHYKVMESSRGVRGIPTKGRNVNTTVSVTGGGVENVYSEENFSVEDAGINTPEGVEAVWAVLTQKKKNIKTVKYILFGGIYIAPRSLHKQAPIDHILQTMFIVQLQSSGA